MDDSSRIATDQGCIWVLLYITAKARLSKMHSRWHPGARRAILDKPERPQARMAVRAKASPAGRLQIFQKAQTSLALLPGFVLGRKVRTSGGGFIECRAALHSACGSAAKRLTLNRRRYLGPCESREALISKRYPAGRCSCQKQWITGKSH